MAKGPDLIDVEFVEEDAGRIAVRVNQEICTIQYGLTYAGLLVFGGNHRKTPGSHMPKKIVVLEW